MIQELEVGLRGTDFHYCLNNPISTVDPWGLDPLVDLLKKLKDIADNFDDLSKCKKSLCDMPGSIRVQCDCLWAAMGGVKDAVKKANKPAMQAAVEQMAECVCLINDLECLRRARNTIKAVTTTPTEK